jgi:hypothetical protein
MERIKRPELNQEFATFEERTKLEEEIKDKRKDTQNIQEFISQNNKNRRSGAAVKTKVKG